MLDDLPWSLWWPASSMAPVISASWYSYPRVPSHTIPGLVCVMAEVLMSRLRLGDPGLQLLEHVISSLNHSLCIWESKPLCHEQSSGEARNQGLLQQPCELSMEAHSQYLICKFIRDPEPEPFLLSHSWLPNLRRVWNGKCLGFQLLSFGVVCHTAINNPDTLYPNSSPDITLTFCFVFSS